MEEKSTTEDPKFIKYLLDQDQEYNCYFLVGNSELGEPEKIGVVKKMLLAHSDILRVELQDSKMAEKGVVRVVDVFPDTFKNLLRYVYGFDITTRLCFDEADDLLYVAEKYMIDTLKASLATRLMSLLTPDNIFTLLNNPACYKELELNSAITTILQDETGRVLSSPQFVNLTSDAFNLILEQGTLNVPEIDLWRAALKWAKHKTGSEDGQVLRKQLEHQTKHIRICTMDLQQFCSEVATSGVLTDEEIKLACLYHGTKQTQESLLNFSSEVEIRKTANKVKWFLHDVISGTFQLLMPYRDGSKKDEGFMILTKKRSIQLMLFEYTANTIRNAPESATYLFDCTIKITRITDYINDTSTESPVTIVFREQVQHSKDIKIPIVKQNQNVILLPENKYSIRVTFTEEHDMWWFSNNENNHMKIFRCSNIKRRFYCPKTLSYRTV